MVTIFGKSEVQAFFLCLSQFERILKLTRVEKVLQQENPTLMERSMDDDPYYTFPVITSEFSAARMCMAFKYPHCSNMQGLQFLSQSSHYCPYLVLHSP
jgi:hypothetical protein